MLTSTTFILFPSAFREPQWKSLKPIDLSDHIRSMHVNSDNKCSISSPLFRSGFWTFNFFQEHPHDIGRQFMAEAIRLSVWVILFILLGMLMAVRHWRRLTCRCWTWNQNNTTRRVIRERIVDLKRFGELTATPVNLDPGRTAQFHPTYGSQASMEEYPAVSYPLTELESISDSPSVSLVDHGPTILVLNLVVISVQSELARNFD